MNNRPVEQALATLLPTHANELPPELLSLALSLVAQSRSYSTSLKPEEEIARPYACAEIACKRLARTLKLPPLLGHPPCPPRVYKKLYAFLDRSLAQSTLPTRRSAAGSLPGTPTRGASSATTSPTKGLASASARTPSKTPRRLQDSPTKSTPVKRTYDGAPTTPSRSAMKAAAATGPRGISNSSTIIKDAPSWVMPSIRTVCKTLATPAPRMSTWSRPPISRTLPPHIFAGVSSILHFVSSTDDENGNNELDEEATEFLEPILTTRDKENDEEFKELVSALIVAVYFLVLARRRNPSRTSSGDTGVESSSSPTANNNNKNINTANGDTNKKMDKKTFAEMRQTALTSLGFSSSEKKHREDVDRWIVIIMDQGWAKGKEWFENVPVAGEDDEAGRNAAEGDDDEEDVSGGAVGSKRRKGMTMRGRDLLLKEDASSHSGLLPGLGTMMQDRVDWLSEDRREDYLEWKEDIMKRIERMESAGKVVG
ncbi:hypothetical protein VTN00DRAFT_3741 [Thermoascus crustaceus]|uniref:uncharacterized protein n=1 Tax=Thermoascus crustaceus TaxID=5088 RepID=UPI00374392CF